MKKFKKSFFNVLSVVVFLYAIYTGFVVLISCVWGLCVLAVRHPVIVGVPVVTLVAFLLIMVVSAILKARDKSHSEKSK